MKHLSVDMGEQRDDSSCDMKIRANGLSGGTVPLAIPVTSHTFKGTVRQVLVPILVKILRLLQKCIVGLIDTFSRHT